MLRCNEEGRVRCWYPGRNIYEHDTWGVNKILITQG